MKVGFIQTSPVFGRVEENVEDVVRRLASPRMRGVELLVLPELFSTGYQFRSRKELSGFAEEVPGGYTVGRLAEIAGAMRLHIVAGIAERSSGRVYNSAVLVGPGGLLGLYRKAHLFWDEKRLFSPGDTPFRVYDIGRARIGMMICFDWLFPEAARRLALDGADIICHPSNLVLPYCPEAMITRTLENRVFAVTANRVGSEERVKDKPLRFIGLSQIVSPRGEILCRASRRRAEARVVDIDPEEARNKRITPKNHIFRDRREDLY